MMRAAFANSLSRRQGRAIVLTGLGVALCAGTLAFSGWRPVTGLDHALLDAFVARAATGQAARDTVVIDIDEVSLSAMGQWPWPRYRIASLLQRIAAEGPAAVALDVLFPEPDRSSLDQIRDTFKRDFNVDVGFSGVPGGLLDNDGFLGQEIGRTRAVGANYFYFDHSTRADAPQPGVIIEGAVNELTLPDASGALVNVPALASRTRLSGFVNSKSDDDGVLRRLPLLIRYQGVVHPNLSLAAVMQALGVSTGTIESDANGWGLRIGTHRIPIDRSGYATLSFAGKPALYGAISAVDVLSGNFRPADIRGKVVFIGTSVVGLKDLHHTAVDNRFPGLKVQAVMTDNILNDRFVTTPRWAPGAIMAACVLAGGAMAALFVIANGLAVLLGLSVAGAAAALAASAGLFSATGLFVSPALPLVLVALLFGMFCACRFSIEKKRALTWRRQLDNARQVTIESMAAVAETRDPETGAHIKRTQHYVRAIALALRRGGRYPEVLTPEFIDLLFLSAPLHDIGKVGVPDHILLKPGRHTPEEMQIMRKHAEFGRQVILNTAERIEGDNFLQIAGDIAATHHEKWDGTGYPRGLAGTDIPLSGRIMAVADIYDALISRRCYKEAFTHHHATTLMRGMRGTTFDPVLLDTFFEIEDTIKDIAARFRDPEGSIPEPAYDPVEYDSHGLPATGIAQESAKLA